MGSICIIEANPDVSGIGIRASIYALVLASRIFEPIIHTLSHNPKDNQAFHESIQSALSIQGFALLCTAIYQTALQQLTLFHGICVIHLLALLGINVVPKARYSSRNTLQAIFSALLLCLALLAFLGWTLYVWITAPVFGSQPACNASTIYVVFGVSINVAEPLFRWTMVVLMSLTAVALAVNALIAIPIFGAMLCFKKDSAQSTSSTTNNGGPDHNESNPIHMIIEVVALLAFDVYAIVSLEQTISRNNVSPEERQWTFGQVIALFLLIGAGLDLFNLCLAAAERSRYHEIEDT